jgi:hypothetical protein
LLSVRLIAARSACVLPGRCHGTDYGHRIIAKDKAGITMASLFVGEPVDPAMDEHPAATPVIASAAGLSPRLTRPQRNEDRSRKRRRCQPCGRAARNTGATGTLSITKSGGRPWLQRTPLAQSGA